MGRVVTLISTQTKQFQLRQAFARLRPTSASSQTSPKASKSRHLSLSTSPAAIFLAQPLYVRDQHPQRYINHEDFILISSPPEGRNPSGMASTETSPPKTSFEISQTISKGSVEMIINGSTTFMTISRGPKFQNLKLVYESIVHLFNTTPPPTKKHT